MLDEYISMFGKPSNVLIDRQESVYGQWGVISWPSVIITDKAGLVVEKVGNNNRVSMGRELWCRLRNNMDAS